MKNCALVCINTAFEDVNSEKWKRKCANYVKEYTRRQRIFNGRARCTQVNSVLKSGGVAGKPAERPPAASPEGTKLRMKEKYWRRAMRS
jgi:hypothetical protein